jgi:hypothetical protein
MKLFLALFAVAATVVAAPLPKGWWAANSDQYRLGVDMSVLREGKPSAVIESIVPEPAGFIAFNQTFSAENYRGKRIRLAGYIKTQDVAKWSGFWLRADDAKGGIVAFDNMQNRGVAGTADWTRAEIVLDVPVDAEALFFGLILEGKGKAWMNGLSFEVVNSSVPVTTPKKPELPKAPMNLDFSD